MFRIVVMGFLLLIALINVVMITAVIIHDHDEDGDK
jgi:hypothetical protein